MTLRRLNVKGFRNLSPQQLCLADGITVVAGLNGSGKTNLLEAISVLGNLASFRTPSALPLIQHRAPGYVLGGTVARDGTNVEIRQEVASSGERIHRSLFRGARRLAAPEYLDLLPVTVFSSLDRSFLWGPPEERRRFLDRVAFYRHPEALLVLQRYRRLLRQRNALLARDATDAQFDAFEYDFASLGARVVQLRLEALAALESELEGELDTLGWSLSRPNLRYDAPDGLAPADPGTMARRLRATLMRMRQRERSRRHTLVGPHRHDLAVHVRGAAARDVLSAGQGKLLTTALKLATTGVLGTVRGLQPVLVFDDVDAEFDADVLTRVLSRLRTAPQALLSSAHDDLMLPRLAGATLCRMRAGTVTEAPREGPRVD